MNTELLLLVGIVGLVVVSALAVRRATSPAGDGCRAWRAAARRLDLEVCDSERLQFARLAGSVDGRRILAWMEPAETGDAPEDDSDRQFWIETELCASRFDDIALIPSGDELLASGTTRPASPLSFSNLDDPYELRGAEADDPGLADVIPQIEHALDNVGTKGLTVAIEDGRLEIGGHRDVADDESREIDRIVESFETTLQLAETLDDAVSGGD